MQDSTAHEIEYEYPHDNELGVVNEINEKEMYLISSTKSISNFLCLYRY